MTQEEILAQVFKNADANAEISDLYLEAMTIYARQEAGEAFDAGRDYQFGSSDKSKETYLKDKYGEI